MGLASRLFNGAAEQTLYARVTPSTEQVEFLQTQWNELAEHLKRELSQRWSATLKKSGRTTNRMAGGEELKAAWPP